MKYLSNPNLWILLLILAFFLTSRALNGQENRWKNYLVIGSTSLASGMIDGTIESINYHYYTGFKPHFKNVNDQFWNPELSWKNKYRNNDPALGPKFTGSTGLLVCMTDAYHMLRTSKRALTAFSIAYCLNQQRCEPISNKKKWRNIARDFLFITAVRCVGFTLTYDVMFRPQSMN